MMSFATISRPSLDFYTQEKIPYTPLANDLFHHGDYGLKPRDASVLYYFLSKKPQGWVIIKESVAKALKIGESTVSRALTKLVDLGFARYERDKKGHTRWFFSIPEAFVKQFTRKQDKSVLSFSEKPHSQIPHEAMPHDQNGDVLVTNNFSEKNNETTNNSVVVPLPDYINKTDTVKNELGALDAKIQVSVLKILTSAMLCAGKVKNPTGYLIELVRNAAKGALSVPNQASQSPTSKTAVKPNNNVALVNLRNELANVKRLYDLSPNPALLSQIQAIEEKLNKAVV